MTPQADLTLASTLPSRCPPVGAKCRWSSPRRLRKKPPRSRRRLGCCRCQTRMTIRTRLTPPPHPRPTLPPVGAAFRCRLLGQRRQRRPLRRPPRARQCACLPSPRHPTRRGPPCCPPSFNPPPPSRRPPWRHRRVTARAGTAPPSRPPAVPPGPSRRARPAAAATLPLVPAAPPRLGRAATLPLVPRAAPTPPLAATPAPPAATPPPPPVTPRPVGMVQPAIPPPPPPARRMRRQWQRRPRRR